MHCLGSGSSSRQGAGPPRRERLREERGAGPLPLRITGQYYSFTWALLFFYSGWATPPYGQARRAEGEGGRGEGTGAHTTCIGGNFSCKQTFFFECQIVFGMKKKCCAAMTPEVADSTMFLIHFLFTSTSVMLNTNSLLFNIITSSK